MSRISGTQRSTKTMLPLLVAIGWMASMNGWAQESEMAQSEGEIEEVDFPRFGRHHYA